MNTSLRQPHNIRRTYLSAREQDVLRFIRTYLECNGFSPSYEEISVFLGCNSKHSVLTVVDRLVFVGLLRKLPNRKRALELVEAEDNHAPDCACDGCAASRYLADRKLVEALQVVPEFPRGVWLNGLRKLSARTRVFWRDGFPPSLTGDAA